MRHLKKYELFEEVSLTPAKKIELTNLIRQKVKTELEEWISPGKGIRYSNQRRISSLIKIAEENGVPNLERTLTEIRKKLTDSQPASYHLRLCHQCQRTVRGFRSHHKNPGGASKSHHPKYLLGQKKTHRHRSESASHHQRRLHQEPQRFQIEGR
jgi:hypothetical protein